MFTLILRCKYPAQLIGFYHQIKTATSDLSFAKLVPCEPKDALYQWGTTEDAAEVQYDYSDDGVAIYRFETSYPPYEWLRAVRGCYPWLSVSLTRV